MIKAIEIILNNGMASGSNYLISYTNKVCYFNDKKYELNDEFLDKLKHILLYWKNEYGTNNKLIDAEEFTITVYSDDGEDKFHGKGIYPDNYGLLKELLGDING